MRSRALLIVALVVGQVIPATAGAIQGDARHGGRTTVSVLRFERASVWSLHITSNRLLADYGYAVEYAFRFLDEEELSLSAVTEQEIMSGRVLTILDGEPVEAEIHLRGEPLPLVMNSDGVRVVAAWRRPDRLIPADLPAEEIERRFRALTDLRAQTRRRLGLAQFRPSQDARVRVRLAAVDSIALVPVGDPRQLYEVQQPMTEVATEVLTREVGGRHWMITWGQGVLQVQLSPVLTTLTTTVFYREGHATGRSGNRLPLSSTDAAQIAETAFAYLRAARLDFGTGLITTPLPRTP
ncbi:MAG: hypothetical protein AUH31_07455 [Armatimonadetes bacterium 13_1_40CM_64_14]|nr:MAG: hypothetical protein AUH31_07455 [Armatimonadetes bacterium 13_1_40CM_64_14]